MKEIEKILEEIDETIERYGKNPYIDEKVTDLCYGLNRARDIIRKHMNDGWVPVNEWLPEEPPEEVDDEDNLEEYIVMIEGSERPTTLRYAGAGTWWEDGTYYPVVAWRPLPDPYIQKENANEKD